MLLPLLASALVVFGSPYVGEIRGALQSAFPEQYRWIIGVIVAIGLSGAVVSTVALLSRRGVAQDGAPYIPLWLRYALVALAVGIAAGYARAVSTGMPDVDLVEAFHFVEYGLITYLFHRAWRRHADVSAIVFPACAGLLVGVADEWMQWLVPGRVGELHDVWLNAVAIGCGLLFSVAIHPPASLALPRHRAPRLALAATISGLIVAVAGFVDCVHLGYGITEGQAGVFRSRYDALALAAAAAERPARWRVSPPPQRGLAREDHYLSEGLWHVQRRNVADGDGDAWTAWNENLILERYYAPVLDRGFRWHDVQRAVMEQRARGAAQERYLSGAEPYPIYLAPRWTVWGTAALFIAAIVGAFAAAAPDSSRAS